MKENYHTHTFRCNHATGTEREYIEKAIEAGMKVFGFSDHSPYPFPAGHRSGFRMSIADLDDYMKTLEDLRAEYKDHIKILIGFEAEYYPALFEGFLRLLEPYDYDYLIMGQHFLENETTEIYSGARTDDERRLKLYVDQTTEGLKTGCFTYFAHPDLVNFTGSPEIYNKHTERLCLCAKELGIPLEINFLGMKEGRPYPCDRFFEIAARVGNEVIFGCDAHSPEAVNDPATLVKCLLFAEKHGLKVIESPVLRNPKAF